MKRIPHTQALHQFLSQSFGFVGADPNAKPIGFQLLHRIHRTGVHDGVMVNRIPVMRQQNRIELLHQRLFKLSSALKTSSQHGLAPPQCGAGISLSRQQITQTHLTETGIGSSKQITRRVRQCAIQIEDNSSHIYPLSAHFRRRLLQDATLFDGALPCTPAVSG